MIEKMQTDGYIVINMEEQIDSPWFETENVDKSLDASTPPKISKARHRASVACSTCRDRRIRCVVPPDAKECIQCKRSGVNCIIKNDDERRRPISRAYVCSLTDRIALLEALLKEQGIQVPPANHPPKNRQPPRGERPASRRLSKIHFRAENQRSEDDHIKSEHTDEESVAYQGEADSPGSPMLIMPENGGPVSSAVEKDVELDIKSTVVPARRRSADETTGQPKITRASRPRANTDSMSLVSLAGNTNVASQVEPSPSRQENSTEYVDGFMTSPGAEASSWQPFLEPAPNLEFGFSTPSSTNASTPGCSAWMGAECEATDPMTQLASLDFSTLPALEKTQDLSHPEFLSLNKGVDDWERAWAGIAFVNELNAFAAQSLNWGSSVGWSKAGV